MDSTNRNEWQGLEQFENGNGNENGRTERLDTGAFSVAELMAPKKETQEAIKGVYKYVKPLPEEAQAAFEYIYKALKEEKNSEAKKLRTQPRTHSLIFELLNDLSLYNDPEAQRSSYVQTNDAIASQLVTAIFPQPTAKKTDKTEFEIKQIFTQHPEIKLPEDFLTLPRFTSQLDDIFKQVSSKPDLPVYLAELIRSAGLDGSLDLFKLWLGNNDWPSEVTDSIIHSDVKVSSIADLEALVQDQIRKYEASQNSENSIAIQESKGNSIPRFFSRIAKWLKKKFQPTPDLEIEPEVDPELSPITRALHFQRHLSKLANKYASDFFGSEGKFSEEIENTHDFTFLNQKMVGATLPITPGLFTKLVEANAKTHLGHSALTVYQSPVREHAEEALEKVEETLMSLCHEVSSGKYIFNPLQDNDGKVIAGENSVHLTRARFGRKPMSSVVRKLMNRPDDIKQVAGQVNDIVRGAFTLDPTEVCGDDLVFNYEKHSERLHEVLVKVLAVLISQVGTDVDMKRLRYRFLNGKAKTSSTGKKKWFAITMYVRYQAKDGKYKRTPFEFHIELPMMPDLEFEKLQSMSPAKLTKLAEKAEKADHDEYEQRQFNEIKSLYGINVPFSKFLEDVTSFIATGQEIPTLINKPFDSIGQERPIVDRMAIVLLNAMIHQTDNEYTNQEHFLTFLNNTAKSEKLHTALKIIQDRNETAEKPSAYIKMLIAESNKAIQHYNSLSNPEQPTGIGLENISFPTQKSPANFGRTPQN